jgi:hypothetical protein
VPCQFYAQGRCRNGTSCPFSHADGSQIAVTPPQALVTLIAGLTIHAADAAPQVDSRSRIPCRFHLRGACSKGDECPFAHDIPKNVSETAVEAEVRSHQEVLASASSNP